MLIQAMRKRVLSGILPVLAPAAWTCLCFLLCFGTLQATLAASNGSALDPAFDVRGLDITLPLPLDSGQTQEDAYRQVMGQMVASDLNVALLNLGNTVNNTMGLLNMGAGNPDPRRSCSKDEVSRLIVISRQHGIEPILEMKMLGKMYPILSGVNGGLRKKTGGLVQKMPGLFRRLPNGRHVNTLDLAYRTPEGKDVYQAVLFPLVDEMLSLYGSEPARYFLLGVDELEVDEVAESAKKLGISPSQLFAQFLIRMTEHLSSRGVTPIIFGDILLSRRLAKKGHGVNGYPADPRFAIGSYYNSTNYSTHGVDLLTAMNYIPRGVRQQIIVANWHYRIGYSESQYPSVDYFQIMGFKDVWGAVWWNRDNTRKFSQYALKRQCGGMLLMTYGMLGRSPLSALFQTKIRNAGTWFLDPSYQPEIEYLPLTIRDAQGQGGSTDSQLPICLPSSTTTVQVSVPLPNGYVPSHASLEAWPNLSELHGKSREESSALAARVTTTLNYDAGASALIGEITLPKLKNDPALYDFNLLVLSPDQRYMIQNLARQSLLLGTKPPVACDNAAGTSNSDWLCLDVPPTMQQGGLWLTGGQVPGMLYHRPLASPTIQEPVTYVKVPPALWRNIETQGLVWRVTFQPAKPIQKGSRDIVSLGNFREGFRLLYNGDRQEVSIQFSRGVVRSGRLWLHATNTLVGPGQLTTAVIRISAPAANGSRAVSFQVGQGTPIHATLNYPLEPTTVPLVLGGEFNFNQPFDFYRSPGRLSWNGQVTQIRMSPLSQK